MHTVHGKKFFMEFRRDQSLVRLFSISFCVTYFILFYFSHLTSSANKTNDLVLKEIEHFSEVLFKWFDFNYMKINSGKSHILFSGNDNVSANISESKNELLGIILDLKDHINNVKKQVKNSTY